MFCACLNEPLNDEIWFYLCASCAKKAKTKVKRIDDFRSSTAAVVAFSQRLEGRN